MAQKKQERDFNQTAISGTVWKHLNLGDKVNSISQRKVSNYEPVKISYLTR